MFTSVPVVKVRAPLCEHATAVNGIVLAQPRVTLDALHAMAEEAVTGGGGVNLDALTNHLAVSLLVELTYDAFWFLRFK